MTNTKERKLKNKRYRQQAELNVLAGPETDWRQWILRKYAKVLRDTGAVPEHVQMYRNQIEDTEVPEPDTRLQPKVVEPTDAERSELEGKWDNR